MKKLYVITLVLGIALLGAAQPLAAQKHPQRHPISARNLDRDRIGREVYHELVMLPYYSVFDNIEYRIDGDVLALMGQVMQPSLKRDAERAVRNIEGISSVNNQIEVLPPSPADDRIRLAVYRALYYGDSPLFHYGVGAQYPIRIIVKNGHVTLTGVVSNESDRTIASLRAHQVPGTFSVTNNLMVSQG